LRLLFQARRSFAYLRVLRNGLACVVVSVERKTDARTTFNNNASGAHIRFLVMPHRTRVLVVDDNQDMVAALLPLLESYGYNAKGIYSARTIVADVRDFDPDIIIMDIAMPGKDGWDAAREVRQHKPGQRPMLIAMTGQYPKDGDKMLAEMSGYDYYLIKPFDTKVLLQLAASYSAK
jgi:CheY-like chemotaxis protein